MCHRVLGKNVYFVPGVEEQVNVCQMHDLIRIMSPESTQVQIEQSDCMNSCNRPRSFQFDGSSFKNPSIDLLTSRNQSSTERIQLS